MVDSITSESFEVLAELPGGLIDVISLNLVNPLEIQETEHWDSEEVIKMCLSDFVFGIIQNG